MTENRVSIPEPIFHALMAYLMSRPVGEVYQLIKLVESIKPPKPTATDLGDVHHFARPGPER